MNRVLSRTCTALIATSSMAWTLALAAPVSNVAYAVEGESSSPKRLPLCKVKPLAADLDKLPMLNSNCPEVVSGEGLLVSTMSGVGRSWA